ncbi:AraC family transcriptional regulator [Tenacibaculum sp. 190130A14a]|uniref:AraC family transcriptional regulator n=1 Tax=Tenacibaculum polynesiense TaxID=3137857 RepID=A0ABP1F268_9FLAO
MRESNNNHQYSELYPSKGLEDFISLYFEAKNLSDKPKKVTICPDGYFKLIIQVKENKITSYFLTGIWVKEIEIVIPAKVTTYGVKFKIIASEAILKREIKSILNSVEQLNFSKFDINNLNINSFKSITKQLEDKFYKELNSENEIQGNRLRLSQFLYSNHKDIQANEVANQIYWSHRQINRYLNKYIGVTLKKYLNIQKCYRSYLHIREGDFFPEKGFFDQAHFIREVKKHTGQTPTSLFKDKNDHFIQLKNIDKL